MQNAADLITAAEFYAEDGRAFTASTPSAAQAGGVLICLPHAEYRPGP